MYLTRLTGKDLPSLCTRPALLAAGVVGSLLSASLTHAQGGWQAVSGAGSIWALAQEESTLPWEWAERIQPGVLPGRLDLETPVPAAGWLIPYRPTLSDWVEVPYRLTRPDAGDVAYRLLRYPVRPPRRHPGSLPLLPEREYLARNPNLLLWSGNLEASLGDVVLLEPGQSAAGVNDSIWVTGIKDADFPHVYFLPPGFVTPPGPIAESGFRIVEGTGQAVDPGQSLTEVAVQTASSELSIGHRAFGGRVDDLWNPDMPLRFADQPTRVPRIIPLEATSGRSSAQSVFAGQEVGLPVGATDGMATGQAWRVVRPGISRFDPLWQSTIQYPDQTIAHILTLRVYDDASVAFILSGSVPAGVSLMLEPV